MKNIFSSKDILPATLLIINLFLAIACFLVVKQSRKLSPEVTSLQANISRAANEKKRIEEFRQGRINKEELEAEGRMLPGPEDFYAAWKEVGVIIDSLGIRNAAFSDKDDKAGGSRDLSPDGSGLKAIPFKVKFDCEYNSLLSFFRKLSSNRLMINVVDLEIKRSESKFSRLEVTLKLNAYSGLNQ